MNTYIAQREDGKEFYFSCADSSEFIVETELETSYILSESPYIPPAETYLIPAREGATQAFVNEISSYCKVLNSSDLLKHTFSLDKTHYIVFGESFSNIIYRIDEGETVTDAEIVLSGYVTLPYCDDGIKSLAATFSNSGGVVEFNWYADTPEQARIYATPTINVIPSINNYSAGSRDFIYSFWQDIVPYTTTDPYVKDGESSTGGGTGNLDGKSDSIDIPGLPTLSATDTGFITLFNPSAGQLKALANYMWSNDLFNLDTYKKIFNDPMDCIMGLAIVPVAVPSGSSADVTIGNILTSVSMPKVTSQYVSVDCGTLNVNEYWGAYLDYDPYTKAEIYLPYCGTHPLKTDDIMGKSVHVVYHVDILSGACCAFVKCGDSVLYSFIGQCSSAIPISGSDMTNVINGVLGIAGAVGTMVATGGLTAPISASTIAGAVGSVSASASNVMNMKPNVEKSGAMGGTGGMLGVQKPYIILTRPRQCLPANQNEYEGYPSYITRKISGLSGYTIFEEIHLEGLSCTDDEKKEIENILKTGVIL